MPVDVSSSWLVRLAPLRAFLVGVVLVVLGVTGEGYWPLLWVGAAAIVVAVVGAVLLWRRRPSRR
ncbi:hypothetical protein GCM10027047_00490 [Rhodococcus aerolatus]